MARKHRFEKGYYEPVRPFLKNELGCVVESLDRNGSPRPFICRGLDRVIVDVYGVRGIEERHSRVVEGIAVEVKRSRKRTWLRHVLQAAQYSKLAHRCYLAQPREFDNKTVIEASRAGIGLLAISKNGVKRIAESRPFSPDPEKFSLFLHKSLSIFRCALCGCYRFRYQLGRTDKADKGYIKGHWVADQIAPKRRNSLLNKKMFLCGRCEGFIGGIAKTGKLLRTVARLESKVQRMRIKLDSF